MISVFDRIKVSNKKFENKIFEETKKDLESLHGHNDIFEELEKSSIFEAENSMYIKNDVPVQIKLLISEIKVTQEITERLHSLVYNVGWLKSAIFIKDKNIISKATKNIIKHEYSSISSLISELNSLKNKIEKFENLYTDLLSNDLLSLDIKILLEQDFKNKHKKLDGLHKKQKNILLNLSNIFIKLTKDYVLKNK